MNILLLDDDSFLRDMYATKFSELGHIVKATGSGEEALSMIGEEVFDIVLLDMVMPMMTGLQFLKSAKELPNTNKTKFIVLSNQGEESDRTQATDLGAVGYIVKAESIPSDVVRQVESIVGTNKS